MNRILALILVLGVTSGLHAADKPNVLLVCVDDLKPLLGCCGDKTVQSPNIDRLATRGVLFERAYCNQTVCAPSRNALLTGLCPQTLGIYDLGTNFRKAVPDAMTLPQYFKTNGYRTERPALQRGPGRAGPTATPRPLHLEHAPGGGDEARRRQGPGPGENPMVVMPGCRRWEG